MNNNNKIDIPFGAFDSELGGFKYTIPEGFEAEIKDGKVIVRKKESEDERMINFLYCELTILCAKECNEGGNGSDRYNTLVAAMDWLEKQKENPQNTDSIPSNCASDAKCEDRHNKPGDFVFKLRQIISRHWWADEHSDRIEDEEGMAKEILELCEKQKEQKPTEQLGGTFSSYDMAKTFAEGQNYVITHPEKFGLCKPAEWNDIDELKLQTIEAVIARQKGSAAFGGFLPEELIDYLKSLRPRPYWKPSEEQMSSLAWWKSYSEKLESLYNDLQKLM